jgi:hypothetical protein
MRHSDILRLVAAETEKRPDAFTDFLDALVLSANNISNHYADKQNEASAQQWLQIAAGLDGARKVVDEVVRPLMPPPKRRRP